MGAPSPLAPRPQTLEAWLAYCERIHPQKIELGLDRVRAVYQRMGLAFRCPVFTVAGTNGKGSTCAMLESMLRHCGYRTGVYTSPHLVQFEERCRVDGQAVLAAALVPHFEAVQKARGQISLSYFEFTTLAILSLLAQSESDVVILEVGLGGRLDAVNVVDADCALITSIDIDHTDFLGTDREAIGLEKAGIMRPGRPVVVSDPLPPQSVKDAARACQADLRCIGLDFGYTAQRDDRGHWWQWSWRGQRQSFNSLAYPALRGSNQLLNAAGALAALEAMHARLPVTAQAVRLGLSQASLPGRFQILPGQPVVVLDVAHNPHAVAALAHNLDQMNYAPCTRAVFGAMGDKDLRAMIEHLIPMVDHWYCTDLPTARAVRAQEVVALIQQVLQHARGAGRAVPATVGLQTHTDPAAALSHARAEADPTDRIVVFGSFYTVGGVLAEGVPQLSALRQAAQKAE